MIKQTFNKLRTSIVKNYILLITLTTSHLFLIPYKKLSHLEVKDKNSYPLTLIRDYKHQFLKRRTFTEKLMILENIDELINHIKTNYKNTYYDILSARHPSLIHLENRK